jgi:hypothetical protein
MQGVKSAALMLPRSKTAEPNSGVAFKGPCCNLKPRELENVAQRGSIIASARLSAERADSALFEAGEFLLLGCTKIIASFVILVAVSFLNEASTIELNRNI